MANNILNIFKNKKSEPCFIIAELGSNHHNDFSTAIESIRIAKEIGADAIKVQTFVPSKLAENRSKNEIEKKKLLKIYEKSYLPIEWLKQLKDFADTIGIVFFSTPFHKSVIVHLDNINVSMYKISSFELTDLELVRAVAYKKKPILLSTGKASLKQIREAINVCHEEGNYNIIIMKCTSLYPSPDEEMSLEKIKEYQKELKKAIGLSDHSKGIIAPIIATAYGVKVIEKHFTLNKEFKTADANVSLDPIEFKQMVKAIRRTEKMIK